MTRRLPNTARARALRSGQGGTAPLGRIGSRRATGRRCLVTSTICPRSTRAITPLRFCWSSRIEILVAFLMYNILYDNCRSVKVPLVSGLDGRFARPSVAVAVVLRSSNGTLRRRRSLQDLLSELRLSQVRHIQTDHDRRCRAQPATRRRARDSDVGGDSHVPGTLDERPKAMVNAAAGGPWSTWKRSSAVSSRCSTLDDGASEPAGRHLARESAECPWRRSAPRFLVQHAGQRLDLDVDFRVGSRVIGFMSPH